MRQTGENAPPLGLLNEMWVRWKLSAYTGNALQASLPAPLRFLAQLVGFEGNLPAEESALEVQLKRKSDGVYEIIGTRATSVLHGVKPTFADGGVVTANIGDRTFTQTFSPVEVSIAEDFEDDGTIHLVDYQETPLEEVTVFVGLGDARVTEDGQGAMLPDGSVVTIAVAVSPCNDSDEDGENDCPKPMFRGAPLPPPTVDALQPTEVLPSPMAKEVLRESPPPPTVEEVPPSSLSVSPAPPSPFSRVFLWLVAALGLAAGASLGGIAFGWWNRRKRGEDANASM